MLIDIELCHFVSSRSGTRIIRLYPPTHSHPSSVLSPPTTSRTAITISLWYIAVDKKQDTIDWYWTLSRRVLGQTWAGCVPWNGWMYPWEEWFFVIVIIYGSTFIYIDNFNLFISASRGCLDCRESTHSGHCVYKHWTCPCLLGRVFYQATRE